MHLKRHQRSLLSRLICGIMPLEIEVGRFTNIPEELRTCKVCNLPVVENEFHFLFDCAPLQKVRSTFYVVNDINIEQFMLIPDPEKVIFLLGEDWVKRFGDLVVDLYYERRNNLYKPN